MEPIAKVFLCASNPNIKMEKPLKNQELNTNVVQMLKKSRYQVAGISTWIS